MVAGRGVGMRRKGTRGWRLKAQKRDERRTILYEVKVHKEL